ncbi:MAG: M23 family metallopeptidase [Acidimicrobiia bacterium]
MTGRVVGGLFAVAIAMAALILVTAPSLATDETPPICPPVTIDDLFPPETTTTVEASTTTSISTTTTVSEPLVPENCEPFVYEMGWPLATEGRFISGFGAPRDGGERRHLGVDVAAPILTPVVAVADGRVSRIRQEPGTDECCWLVVEHSDNWKSLYIHMNNDTYGTDDGQAIGVRPDLKPGTRVKRGEVIAWVGDSGNAEHTVVHLHFELRDPSGTAVDPWESMKTARKNADFRRGASSGPYLDGGGPGAQLAYLLVTQGVHLPCDSLGLYFCPLSAAPPEFAAEMTGHLVGSEAPAVEGAYRSIPGLFGTQVSESTMTQLIGCRPLETCLEFGVPETELARLAVWARIVSLPTGSTDPEESTPVRLPSPAEAETTLRRLGLLRLCHPSLDSDKVLTRSETLDRLNWWVLDTEPNACPPAYDANR